jgi:hypothetical protein
MDGVAVIRQLLAADAAVTAMVPATSPGGQSRMSADPLAQGVDLPAISLEEISAVDRNIPAPGATRFVTARIQVTGHARNYPELRALMKAIKNACADQRPTVTGLTNVVVLTDGTGPQGISAVTNARTQTQDFKVTYNEER